MTLLSDTEIFAKLTESSSIDPLIIHPILDTHQIFGAKIDLRIDNELFRFKQGKPNILDVDSKIVLNDIADKIICPYGTDLAILPDELLFAYTYEYVKMPKNMTGRIEARARLAKLGLIVSSGIIDPGFSDHIFLSFFNAGKFPLRIRPLTRVVSLTIEKLTAVRSDFQHRPVVREKLDPDHLVVSIPDYDSLALKTFSTIISEDV